MSTLMDDEIKRWAARRKSALVLEITQGETTVAEASRSYDLAPSEIGKYGARMASAAWRTRCEPTRRIFEQYEKQLRELQGAYGEAMLELRVGQ